MLGGILFPGGHVLTVGIGMCGIDHFPNSQRTEGLFQDCTDAPSLFRTQLKSTSGDSQLSDAEYLQGLRLLHEVSYRKTDYFLHLFLIISVRLQQCHGIGPQGLKQILQAVQIDHGEITFCDLHFTGLRIQPVIMPDTAFCGIVHRRSFFIAGDDSCADAGFAGMGMIHIIVRHVVIPDILLIHRDIAEVYRGIVPRDLVGQVDGGHAGSAFQDPQRGIRFFLSLYDFIFYRIQGRIQIHRPLERFFYIFLMRTVWTGISGFILGKCSHIVAAHLFLDIP